MYKLPSTSEKELREELLLLAEDLQGDILLLECLARTDLSDCCEPSELEPLRCRLHDYINQHAHDTGHLAEALVSPPKAPCRASSRQ